ncbi:MAG: phosphoribosyl-AMP cyclohydrolase [Planctomycetota bacterium]|nr:phosphoribosyl-AMP cyclohydrolase [Planctomycetota bacterium]
MSKNLIERLPERPDAEALLGALSWDAAGLVTVVARDAKHGEVLMVAHANRAALEASLATGFMHYYSRSRGKLWKKGEESGHAQRLVRLRFDCDGDAILAEVEQTAGACHLGYRSCFAYEWRPEAGFAVVGERAFDPARAYRKKG